MDDAVAQAGMGLLLPNEGVSIDDPIHGTIADRMGADRDAVLVEEANHFLVNSGVYLRVARLPTPELVTSGVVALRSQPS
jgi:hypothetical protein